MFTLPVVTTIFSHFLMRYSLRPNAVTLTRDVPDRFDRFPGRIGQEELVGFLKMKFCSSTSIGGVAGEEMQQNVYNALLLNSFLEIFSTISAMVHYKWRFLACIKF